MKQSEIILSVNWKMLQMEVLDFWLSLTHLHKKALAVHYHNPPLDGNAFVVSAQIRNEEQWEEKASHSTMWTYGVCLNLYLFSVWQWMITLLQWYLLALLEYGVCHFFLFWIVVHGFKKCPRLKCVSGVVKEETKWFFHYFLWNSANQFEAGGVPNLNARYYGFRCIRWFLVGISLS